ncbi:MAG TPA: ABC transporter permease subunit [Streptosporangiaceae bacterium]|nr:ABC transporter permease subunit [Streptosporangiaceae bacterium]
MTLEPPIAASADAAARIQAGHYRFSAMLDSERIKIISVRSTVWALLATAVAGIGLSTVVTSAQAARYTARTAAGQQAFDPTRSSLSGILFAQLSIGVLAVLVVTAEYSTGTIRATLSAVPRRSLVLIAKVVLFSAITFVVGEAVSFIAFLIGQAILSGRTPTASLSDPSALRAVVGGGLYLVALGLLALGLATIIRHTAASISAFAGSLFVLPIIAAVLPSSYSDDVSRFLPLQIGTVMTTAHYQGTDTFGPWTGFILLCAYAAAALITGTVLLVRRDA